MSLFRWNQSSTPAQPVSVRCRALRRDFCQCHEVTARRLWRISALRLASDVHFADFDEHSRRKALPCLCGGVLDSNSMASQDAYVGHPTDLTFLKAYGAFMARRSYQLGRVGQQRRHPTWSDQCVYFRVTQAVAFTFSSYPFLIGEPHGKFEFWKSP